MKKQQQPKKPRGRSGGRKQKYNEPTTILRVPVSKVQAVKDLIGKEKPAQE